MTDPNYTDIQRRLLLLAAFGNGITPTKIPTFPEQSEIDAVGNDLRALARVVDPLIYAIGEYVAANAPGRSVDLSLFTDVLSGALADCIGEIEQAAERVMEAAE